MTNADRRIIGAAMVLVLVLTGAVPALADDAIEARQLVDKARLAMEEFVADPVLGGFRDLVRKAKAVFIAPGVLRAAFIIGASGGSGVLLARDEKTGQWTDPAFYTMGSVSFGLQAGGDSSDVVLLILSQRGLTALLASTIKLGVDASMAAGPMGTGLAGSTAGLSADIVSYSRARGLYGGMSVDGAVVAVRSGLNSAYYGQTVTPTNILIRRGVTNPESRGLIEVLTTAVR